MDRQSIVLKKFYRASKVLPYDKINSLQKCLQSYQFKADLTHETRKLSSSDGVNQDPTKNQHII
jgi:hypothetical protein